MKKVTILLSVFALVMGLLQCRKPSFSALNGGGEPQYVVLSANNGNDGSKVDVDFVQKAMNLTWEKGDKITVSGGLKGTLTLVSGDGGPEATFEGYATKGTGDVVFTYGEPPVFTGQTGTQDCVKENICLEGTSEYKADGNYNVLMKVPYAVLKLDLSALGTAGGNTVTIKAGDDVVASVVGVKNNNASNKLYVAMPADVSEKTYTFSGNGKVVSTSWPSLNSNTFYTANSNGDAVVIGHKFTVDDKGTTVEFAPGNLYYDGSVFKFEANQWSFASTWDASHVSHFKWSDAANAVTSDNSYSGDLFCANNFTMSGDSHTWRTLSKAEWDYLLNTRDNASSLRAWKELDGGTNKGLVILPDGTDASVMSSITTTEALASHGVVFLPAAGYRYGTYVYNVGSNDHCWSSTPGESDNAYFMYFYSGGALTDYYTRDIGYSVRLVR